MVLNRVSRQGDLADICYSKEFSRHQLTQLAMQLDYDLPMLVFTVKGMRFRIVILMIVPLAFIPSRRPVTISRVVDHFRTHKGQVECKSVIACEGRV
ncbi:hypothetical protein AcW2_005217 [Taiwanofungus camphoratus]|nr:hypothetical protein AcW2_005217 [Antrodia cinnamomea]